MSFTADELQAFNDILDKKLAAHRREMEHVFDQRIQTLRRELERRLNTLQQEMLQTLTQKQAEQQRSLQIELGNKLNTQQLNITQAVDRELQQRQQQQQPQIESLVDRARSAQLLAIEELLNQRLSAPALDESAVQIGGHPPHFEAIEVQTELPWEDLIDIFGKVLDERFVKLNEIAQATMRNWEQHLSAHLRAIQTQVQEEALHARQGQTLSGNLTSMQDVFQSIEQLERLIESMQVAMTSNNALLSNRLYHHQQLPLERAHPGNRPTPPSAHPNGTNTNSPLSLPEERPAT
ncbi:MAG: hypothetical protein E6I80_16020 [Chloroflexi bacterium]|nr:MAG: hypothetical protein E6I80_16020 [Chloroflexota bacterium]